MTLTRPLRLSGYLLVSMLAPMMLACSGSTEPDGGCDDCGPGEVQIASSVATPKNATIARGGATNTTVVYFASPNLRITAYQIQKQYGGITVNQTSTQGSGNNVTRAFTISADASVPLGTHIVNFWISVDGATNTVQTTRAEFSLTVTQ